MKKSKGMKLRIFFYKRLGIISKPHLDEYKNT